VIRNRLPSAGSCLVSFVTMPLPPPVIQNRLVRTVSEVKMPRSNFKDAQASGHCGPHYHRTGVISPWLCSLVRRPKRTPRRVEAQIQPKRSATLPGTQNAMVVHVPVHRARNPIARLPRSHYHPVRLTGTREARPKIPCKLREDGSQFRVSRLHAMSALK